MKTVVPSYYKNFVCIASACRHSCCIGWEIDVDLDTYNCYKTLGGDIGKRLTENISDADGVPHFILDETERCPFLNKDGLCDIIIECGEDCLCDICADHPRFRNYFSDRIEIGLGLCCEAAADLIINCKEPFELAVLDDDGFDDEADEDEIRILAYRKHILEVVTDSNYSFLDKVFRLCKDFEIRADNTSPLKWAERLSKLERLDPRWDICIELLGKQENLELTLADEKSAENLLCYFIYRHFSSACDIDGMKRRFAFALFSCRVIFTLANFIPIEEAARMYSAEIEYSDENLNILLNILGD